MYFCVFSITLLMVQLHLRDAAVKRYTTLEQTLDLTCGGTFHQVNALAFQHRPAVQDPVSLWYQSIFFSCLVLVQCDSFMSLYSSEYVFNYLLIC